MPESETAGKIISTVLVFILSTVLVFISCMVLVFILCVVLVFISCLVFYLRFTFVLLVVCLASW